MLQKVIVFVFLVCMNIYVFNFKIVFTALEPLCGALVGYSELQFGSQEAPWELFGGCQRLRGGS